MIKQLILLFIFFLTLSNYTYAQKKDAKFKIKSAQTLSKEKILKGVKRNVFCELPQKEWDILPRLISIQFQFSPSKGNTEDLENTFLLRLDDMGVKVNGKYYPAIGTLINNKFRQSLSYNCIPNDKGKYPKDNTLTLCFLVPENARQAELMYRKQSMTKSSIKK